MLKEITVEQARPSQNEIYACILKPWGFLISTISVTFVTCRMSPTAIDKYWHSSVDLLSSSESYSSNTTYVAINSSMVQSTL